LILWLVRPRQGLPDAYREIEKSALQITDGTGRAASQNIVCLVFDFYTYYVRMRICSNDVFF